MTTSAAVPGWLLRYGDMATQLDDHLARSARTASEALHAFASTWPDAGYPRHDPAADAVQHALRNREVDAWVGRVGEAFRRADLATGGWWACRIPPEPVVVDDALLSSSAVGFATNEQAARAGTAFADDIAHALDDAYGDIDDAPSNAGATRCAPTGTTPLTPPRSTTASAPNARSGS